MSYTTDLTTLAPEFIWNSKYNTSGEVYATTLVAYEPISREARDFDAIDTKGRRFGARAIIKLETRTPSTESNSLTKWIGQRYRLEVQALRNGVSFGGGCHDSLHDTLADVQAAAEKYFAGAEQRALKNKSRKV
jgi:hypothetical protein